MVLKYIPIKAKMKLKSEISLNVELLKGGWCVVGVDKRPTIVNTSFVF